MHSQGVVVSAPSIAAELGMRAEERRLVEFGAMLHDIGKMSTPKEILNKTGPRDDEGWETMRRHTIDGQRMLDQVGGTLHAGGTVVRASRERYDGNGQPDRLRAEEIPLAARAIAVGDAYSAMTTHRSYRLAMTLAVAAGKLRADAGSPSAAALVAAALGRDLRVALTLTRGETAA